MKTKTKIVSSILAFDIKNKDADEKVIRLFDAKSTLDSKDKDKLMQGIKYLNYNYSALLISILERKLRIKSLDIYGDFNDFKNPWTIGYAKPNGVSQSNVYYPLEAAYSMDITPKVDILYSCKLEFDVDEYSYIDIPITGTNEKSGGGNMYIIMKIEYEVKYLDKPWPFITWLKKIFSKENNKSGTTKIFVTDLSNS